MQKIKNNLGWAFTGDAAEFRIDAPHQTSYLYFPLVNESGMMSSVTPTLHGGSTSGHYSFFMPPVSIEDLHNSRSSRNFWFSREGGAPWSAAGGSAKQVTERFGAEAEEVVLEAGFLWQKVTRRNHTEGLMAKVVSFVPMNEDQVELMRVTLTNTASVPQTLIPTAAIPIYGRGADELRDHRHVTSLLQRIYTNSYGMEVQPALSFDERGHRINHIAYSVWGAAGNGESPVGFIPILEDFLGEGGSLDWPEAVVRSDGGSLTFEGAELEGYEAVGALRFSQVCLLPGESASYVVAMMISEGRIPEEAVVERYLKPGCFDKLLAESKLIWEEKLGTVKFHSVDSSFDRWMKWVTLQPILRRLYGNSFLPYHDYGRGGRGWRDLWQDCLALLLMEPDEVRFLLLNNFAGVRFDGSNATIIGSKPGEFVADRNNIPRVWMDHGAWPLLTTQLYLQQSGDLDFLLESMSYFRDRYTHRCKEVDPAWNPAEGQKLKTSGSEIYYGSILEHLLLQNLVPFFVVGEHNVMKLEGADWNDGLDMASHRGESVAFTAFYGNNLRELAGLLQQLKAYKGIQQVELAEELGLLVDRMAEDPGEYNSVEWKTRQVQRFFDVCSVCVSGRKVSVSIDMLCEDLLRKSDWITNHLRKQEWIQNQEGYGWYNGYYNNDGERVEGDFPSGVRMTLTGQVFTVMGGVATDEQTRQVVTAVNRYLKDSQIGYRLNTNFGGVQQNLGRAFGFAFGHKENGAMFSHMTVMYANALYRRGLVREGYEVLTSIYELSTDYERSRMYPGIPEYINERGRGMYPYLTGSASWYLLTMLTEVYGVKGVQGDLLLEPKLLKEQFASGGTAGVTTSFAGRRLQVSYKLLSDVDYGDYEIQSLTVNGIELLNDTVNTDVGPSGATRGAQRIKVAAGGASVVISRATLEALEPGGIHIVEVVLM